MPMTREDVNRALARVIERRAKRSKRLSPEQREALVREFIDAEVTPTFTALGRKYGISARGAKYLIASRIVRAQTALGDGPKVEGESDR